MGVNQENRLFGNAGARLQPERVKFVQQELAVTGCLCFCFPAAFIKGLLLSESAAARLSAAKSTFPSGLRLERLRLEERQALPYLPWATRDEILFCLHAPALDS